jgi:hypothetical protein
LPYALCQIVPHVTEKGYTFLFYLMLIGFLKC